MVYFGRNSLVHLEIYTITNFGVKNCRYVINSTKKLSRKEAIMLALKQYRAKMVLFISIVVLLSFSLFGTISYWAAITLQNKELAMASIKKIFIMITFVAFIIVLWLIIIILRRTNDLQTLNNELIDTNNDLENARYKVINSNQQLQEINSNLEEEINERSKMEKQLSDANQEIIAMNEEVIATNESLHYTNQKLLMEIQNRQEVEEALLFREKQYRAITSLIIHNPDDQANLLYTILNDALLMLQAPAGFIAMINDNSNLVTVSYVQGGVYEENEQFALDQGMFGIVYSTKKLLYVEDYRTFLQRINKKSLDRLTSVVMLPLKYRDRVIGLFAVAWMDTPYVVKQDNLEALQNFADLASVSLENARTRATIEKFAYQDALTGLPNRASFTMRLIKEMDQTGLQENGGFLMFIDIDDLKTVNDTYGHACGDSVICTAGHHILASGGEGAFVARLGGDEFVVLKAGETDRNRIGEIADKILKVLSRDYSVGESLIHLSSSIGIAVYPDDGTTAGDILKNADNAMYAAKKAGKNCWRFYETKMQTDAYERMVLTNSLRRAIERRELSLHYQPQVDIETETIVGFEALLRWNSVEYGSVSPNQFIPLAEKSGLILPIGEWVLLEACRFARKLADIDRGKYTVSANVSPRQLADVNFESIVQKAIAETEIQPSQLQIEITESGLLGCVEESIQKLLRIRTMGVGLSLDDFGTGFSSLTYLQQLPVSELKIDKSFIDSILDISEKKTLVYSVIDMAHALNLKVVAEGVEIREQCEYLRYCHCDRVQGYLFSRPLPESEIFQMVKDNVLHKNLL